LSRLGSSLAKIIRIFTTLEELKMGKTYHRAKPADVDRSRAFKIEKPKTRLNPRDVISALDESVGYSENAILSPTEDEPGGYEPWAMMEPESTDPYVFVPGRGGRLDEFSPIFQGRGKSLAR
jgi:hypothetical protein